MSDTFNVPMWRIFVRSRDGIVMDNEDNMPGEWPEVHARARVLARRASYVVGAPNRVVYVSVERWSYKGHKWVMVWDRKNKVPDTWQPEPPFVMPEVSWRDGGMGGITS